MVSSVRALKILDSRFPMCDVNVITGEVSQYVADVFLPGRIPFHFVRTYSSQSKFPGKLLGYGWRCNLEIELRLANTQAELVRENGKALSFALPPIDADAIEAAPGLLVRRSTSELAFIEDDLASIVFRLPDKLSGRIPISRRQDAYGNAIDFYYSDAGKLSHLVDSAGRRVEFELTPDGRIADVMLDASPQPTDRFRLVSYRYDDRDDLVQVIDPEGTSWTFEYCEHLLVRATDRIGCDWFFEYDRNRRCVRTWKSNGLQYREIRQDPVRRNALLVDSRGFATLYRNNEQGLTEVEIDPLGRVHQDVFDADGNILINTSTMGNIEEFSHIDPKTGVVKVSYNGRETAISRNAQGQPLSITNPEGQTFVFTYDHGGSVTSTISPTGALWRFDYDEQGDLTQAIDPRGYQIHRQRPSSTHLIIADQYGPLTQAEFDRLGNPLKFVDSAGHKMCLEYDCNSQLSRLAYPDGSCSQFAYDAEGNLTRWTDELSRVTTYDYGSFGSTIAIHEPIGRCERFMFDTEENLVRLINYKGEEAKFQYDAVGRVIGITYFDGRKDVLEYDNDDNPIRVSDGAGRCIAEMDYNSDRRLIGERFPDGSTTAMDYGPNGEILLLENPGASLTFKWDSEMRIVKEARDGVILQYAYDSRDNRTSLILNGIRRIEYEWDLRCRLVRLFDSNQWTYLYRFNSRDLVEECDLPNGCIARFKYDSLDRLIRRWITKSDNLTIVLDRSFEYDAADRLIRFEDLHRGNVRYTYDDADRLLQVIRNGNVEEAYSYDLNSNLMNTRVGEPIVFAAGDRISRRGTEDFHYDADGNVIRRSSPTGDTRYEYDAEGRLAVAFDRNGEATSYRYDALARRISKRHLEEEKDFIWDGLALLSESSPNSTIEYLFLPGSFFLAGLTIDGEHFSVAFDQIGTPTELLDKDGRIVWSADYSAFGEVLQLRESQVRNPIRFLGQYHDDECGLAYNRYRYYDPIIGRFLSPDPIGFAGGTNQYLYTTNPINWVDPLGLAVCDVRPKCSWNKKQQEDARKKVKGQNKKLGSKGKAIPPPCSDRKNAKKIYDDCRKKGGALPKLKETLSKCSNQQADHILEVCAGGGEKDCKNLQPLNESVNKSFGSQMGNCAGKMLAAGVKLTKIRLLPMSQCKPGGKKCPDL